MFDVKGMDPISAHQAGLFIDNEHKTDCTKFTIKAAIDTKKNRVLGQQADKPRVRGVSIKGDISFYKSNTWLYEYVKYVQQNQYHKPFDLMGVIDDPGSDFYRKYGVEVVTAKNCTLTGDITIMEASNSCDDVEVTVSYEGEYLE